MMTLEEFTARWNLFREGFELKTSDGDFACAICPRCGKAVPSGATCNAGLHQPEYCLCL